MASKKDLKKVLENADSFDTSQAIFLLKTIYTQMLEILVGFYECRVMPRNLTINHYYASLVMISDDLLNRKDLYFLNKQKPELYDSLIGDLEFLDVTYDMVKNKAYDFLGLIENEYIKLGSPNYEIDIKLASFLENASKALKEHKNYCDAVFPLQTNALNAEIYFDKNTGRGFVNKNKFTCRTKNKFFPLVVYLYDNINQTIPRAKILEFIRPDKTDDSASNKYNTGLINDTAKEIRKLIGIDKETLVNNSGSLTLLGKKLDPPPN